MPKRHAKDDGNAGGSKSQRGKSPNRASSQQHPSALNNLGAQLDLFARSCFYPYQQGAFDAIDEPDKRPFAFEYFGGQGGSRRYRAENYEYFWDQYESLPDDKRHYYEVT